MKRGLCQVLLPDMGQLQKMFPSILDINNVKKVKKIIFQNSTKEILTHFKYFCRCQTPQR